MKYLEIIADNLSKAGWSWGCVSALDCEGRTIFVADAHRDDGQRLIVRADEKLTAFVESQAVILQRHFEIKSITMYATAPSPVIINQPTRASLDTLVNFL